MGILTPTEPKQRIDDGEFNPRLVEGGRSNFTFCLLPPAKLPLRAKPVNLLLTFKEMEMYEISFDKKNDFITIQQAGDRNCDLNHIMAKRSRYASKVTRTIYALNLKMKFKTVTGSIIWQLWTTYASNQPSDKLCFFVQNSSWLRMYKVVLVSD